MAQITMQSKVVRRLCDNTLKREIDDHEKIIERLDKLENEYKANCEKFDFYVSSLGLSSTTKIEHRKRVTKIQSIRKLASLSEYITITDEDILTISAYVEI